MNTIQNMQVTSNNYQRSNVKNNNPFQTPVQTSNVQFKGLLKPRKMSEQLVDALEYASSVLSIPMEDVKEFTKGQPTKRIKFFLDMAEKYNKENFYLTPDKKENPKIIRKIFEIVTNPTNEHTEILQKSKKPFAYLEKIFGLIHDDKHKCKLASIILNDSERCRLPKNDNFLLEMIASENSKEYAKNFRKYESYFILNKNNENAVRDLDKMIQMKEFDPKKYDNELKLKNIFADIPATEHFNPKTLAPYYSVEGNELINHFREFDTHKFIEDAKNGEILTDIYRTTTKDNIDIRKTILEDARGILFNNYNTVQKKETYLADIQKLFNTMDSDKHAMKFIEKHFASGQKLYPVEYNKLFETVEPKKLNIFYDNAVNIISETGRKERFDALKEEIENPFYKNKSSALDSEEAEFYGFKEKGSIFSKGLKSLKNGFNKLRYKMSGSSNVRPIIEAPVAQPVINDTKKAEVDSIVQNVIKPQTEKPVSQQIIDNIKTQPVAEVKVPQKAEIDSTIQNILAPQASKTVTEQIIDNAKNQPVVKPAKLPIAKQLSKREVSRLKVVSDVNDIIKTKLGARTLEDQQKSYERKATKIRLSILPEAFESVKETRKADRLAGKCKPNSSNADVYELYSLANGKNKKLINYMLKKRNADGTRMFEVKEIIATLEEASNNARKNKLTAKEEKAMYDSIFESKVAEHGKLKKGKKVSK